MRIFRLIATPILLLGLLGFLIWAASWGWKALTEPLPSPSPTPCVLSPAETVTPESVTVRIYNGGFTSGLANRVSRELEGAGFTVIRVDNTEEAVTGTIIRTSRSQSAQSDLVASFFVEPELDTDDRVDGIVDVLVGTDFQGFAEEPLGEVEVPGGEICVVPSESPSPSPSPSGSASPAPSPATTP